MEIFPECQACLGTGRCELCDAIDFDFCLNCRERGACPECGGTGKSFYLKSYQAPEAQDSKDLKKELKKRSLKRKLKKSFKKN